MPEHRHIPMLWSIVDFLEQNKNNVSVVVREDERMARAGDVSLRAARPALKVLVVCFAALPLVTVPASLGASRADAQSAAARSQQSGTPPPQSGREQEM